MVTRTRWRWRAESRSPSAARISPRAIRSRRRSPSRPAVADRANRRTRPAGPPRPARRPRPAPIAGTTALLPPAAHPSRGPSAAETTAAAGQECRWGEAVWRDGKKFVRYRRRPARRVLAGDAGVVRRGVRGADAGPGGGVAGDRQGRGHAGRRADRFGQDAGRVLVGDRQAGGGAAARRPETAHPGALRLPAQGAGRGHRAEPARPADRDQARRAPARPGRAGHRGGGAHRRHRRRGTQEAGQPSRRTSSSPPRNRCSCCSPRRPGRPCAGSRRSSWTRCTPSRATSAAPTWRCPSSASTRCEGTHPPPSGWAVRDRAAGRGGGHVPRRHPGGHRGAAAQPQAHRAAGRRPGGGHDRAGHDARARRRATTRRTRRRGGRSGRTSRSGCST